MQMGITEPHLFCEISVIMPVYREERLINQALERLVEFSQNGCMEIIVSDGHPEASTIAAINTEYLNRQDVVPVRSEKGRGVQMNTGAAHAKGDVLLFLHADTVVDKIAVHLLRKTCAACGDHLCGAFDLEIDSPEKVFRIIEKTASLRSRITGLPYGDQGIFLKAGLFHLVNGYPSWPLMEDVGLMRKIGKRKIQPLIFRHAVKTSARRWKTGGVVYTTIRNWVLILLFFAGVSPHRLARFY